MLLELPTKCLTRKRQQSVFWHRHLYTYYYHVILHNEIICPPCFSIDVSLSLLFSSVRNALQMRYWQRKVIIHSCNL